MNYTDARIEKTAANFDGKPLGWAECYIYNPDGSLKEKASVDLNEGTLRVVRTSPHGGMDTTDPS